MQMTDRANVPKRVQKQTFTVDDLVDDALIAKYGPGTRKVDAFFYRQNKKKLEEELVRTSRIASSRKPQEISKVQVDVNEKIYSNNGDSKTEGDNSRVTIVRTTEASEGFNYSQQTSSGLEWGAGTNLGVQFGLPQVGSSASSGVNLNFKKTSMTTTTESHSKETKLGQQSHHEETVTILPGHKVTVTMTSYRVKYQLNYTMEYTVPKTAGIRVKYYTSISCGLCSFTCYLDAPRLLRTLPNYKEDEETVSFTQQGYLTWFADRMEVNKVEQLAA